MSFRAAAARHEGRPARRDSSDLQGLRGTSLILTHDRRTCSTTRSSTQQRWVASGQASRQAPAQLSVRDSCHRHSEGDLPLIFQHFTALNAAPTPPARQRAWDFTHQSSVESNGAAAFGRERRRAAAPSSTCRSRWRAPRDFNLVLGRSIRDREKGRQDYILLVRTTRISASAGPRTSRKRASSSISPTNGESGLRMRGHHNPAIGADSRTDRTA